MEWASRSEAAYLLLSSDSKPQELGRQTEKQP